MASAIGAGWVGILGYLVLGSLNWRFFIVLTSVPFFIPAIILLHLCLPETKSETESDTESPGLTETAGERRRTALRLPMAKALLLRVMFTTAPRPGGFRRMRAATNRAASCCS